MKFSPQCQPTDKLRNLFSENRGDGPAIFNAMKEDWNLLLTDAQNHDRVRNENTFSSSLTTNFLIMAATTTASPKFAPVKMFARDNSVDPLKPLATGEAKYNTTAQDGSTTLTNATNFESGDSNLNAVPINVAQYTESFHVRNVDYNSGMRMADLATAKLASLGSKVTKVLAANITAANFTTLTPIITAPGGFGWGFMEQAWASLKKANRKNIMLDGPYLAKIINTPVFLQTTPVVPGAGWKDVSGWDFVGLNTEWSAAGANISGFACDPQALGTLSGLPLVDVPNIPAGILQTATGIMPGVEVGIAAYSWFNTSTRTYWSSFDLVFGAVALDTSIGLVIASGTPS
jgi:hypothetical protein